MPAVTETVLTPPLKWAGGKRWQVQHLRPLWAPHAQKRLVEPFCGGLAVTLGLMPDKALLNDANAHLINFYTWIQKGLRVEIPLANEETSYYAHRRRFNALLRCGLAETSEAAQLFYYLNRTGYNGLCRFNRRGGFNVPFGRHSTIAYREDFSDYTPALAKWEFSNDTFEQIRLEDGDFVYADPPYDVDFTQYSASRFGWNEQVRTAEWLAAHRGPVVLSNQATPRIVRLYKGLGYQLMRLSAPRRISCNGDRSPAAEVLAVKNVEL